MYGVGIFFACIFLLFAIWLGIGGSQATVFVAPHPSSATSTARTDIDRIVDDAFTSGEPSPYRGQVTIDHNQNGPRAETARTEYLIIKTERGAATGTQLTGWQIENARGDTFVIPGGTETFRTGSVNTVSDIVLAPHQEAVISTGRSPVGASFRENLCTGYLEEHQDFFPSLQASCPDAADELARAAVDKSEECRDFARSLNVCEAATNIPARLPASCAQFAEQYLNHTSCVAAHHQDPSFNGPTWRVFLNQSQEIYGNERDTIKLLDAEGKIVDVLAY